MKESEILIQLRQENNHLDPVAVDKIYNDLKAILAQGLKYDGKVIINGIGIMLVKDRKASRAFQFSSRGKGEVKDVPSTKMICFRVSNKLRKIIKDYYARKHS